MQAITKGLVKLIIVLALLLVVWVIYAVVLNWRDEAPSATTVEFLSYYQDHFPRHMENNAYAYVMGFDVPEDQDPLAWGEQRLVWTHETRFSIDASQEYQFPGSKAEYFAHRPTGVDLLLRACSFGNQDCVSTLLASASDIEEAVAEGGWVVQRYSDLLDMNTWVENIYLHIQAPLPAYQNLLVAQHLYFSDLLLRQDSLSAEILLHTLDRDLRFWRHAQQQSLTLISKMVSAAAIRQNLSWTNQLLRSLPVGAQVDLSLANHGQPLSREELSMYRVFVGEWIFGSHYMGEVIEHPESVDEKAMHPWAKFLFKRQATLNLMAEQHATLIRHVDRPLDKYSEALATMEQLYPQESRVEYFLKPANAVGRILVAVATPAYQDYFVRVGDIEGQRRALVLVHQLRQQQIPLDQVAEAIAASDIRNPYTGDAFEWDAELQAVVFTGLQRGDRARQVFEL